MQICFYQNFCRKKNAENTVFNFNERLSNIQTAFISDLKEMQIHYKQVKSMYLELEKVTICLADQKRIKDL